MCRLSRTDVRIIIKITAVVAAAAVVVVVVVVVGLVCVRRMLTVAAIGMVVDYVSVTSLGYCLTMTGRK